MALLAWVIVARAAALELHPALIEYQANISRITAIEAREEVLVMLPTGDESLTFCELGWQKDRYYCNFNRFHPEPRKWAVGIDADGHCSTDFLEGQPPRVDLSKIGSRDVHLTFSVLYPLGIRAIEWDEPPYETLIRSGRLVGEIEDQVLRFEVADVRVKNFLETFAFDLDLQHGAMPRRIEQRSRKTKDGEFIRSFVYEVSEFAKHDLGDGVPVFIPRAFRVKQRGSKNDYEITSEVVSLGREIPPAKCRPGMVPGALVSDSRVHPPRLEVFGGGAAMEHRMTEVVKDAQESLPAGERASAPDASPAQPAWSRWLWGGSAALVAAGGALMLWRRLGAPRPGG